MFSSKSSKYQPHPFERNFGRREQHPTVTLRHNGRESSVTLKPVTTALSVCVVASIIIGGIVAGAYVSMKDDLVSATLARHARMQHAYEDRITSLRAQVDLVTSRQLLDQQAVENRVDELMERQATIGARQVRVRAALNRAKTVRSLSIGKDAHQLLLDPTPNSSIPKLEKPSLGLRLGSLVGTSDPFGSGIFQPDSNTQLAESSPDSVLFEQMEESLRSTEQAQISELAKLKQGAEQNYMRIAGFLDQFNIHASEETGTGGPLIALKSGDHFLDMLNSLNTSLEALDAIRGKALSLPHGSPTPGQKISSGFGSRRDPFTKRRAVHSGLDYKARHGTPVFATASGVVVKAKRSGGYGKLIEVDHGNGLTTRYAHLSQMKVNVGQRIKWGQLIGKVGSTGRSTGPHLHYEVRKNGQARNPIKFVRLEKKLKPLLQ